jgi:hypothetical protein
MAIEEQSKEILRDRIISMQIWLTGVQEEATRIMKSLEQFSAPGPSKGKEEDSILQEKIDMMNANRLRKIIDNENK